MKILALVITAVLFLTSCTDYKKPISDVIQQRATARIAAVTTNVIPFHPNRVQVTWSDQKFLVALLKINVTKCPKDFRVAWMNYIAARELQNDRKFTAQQAMSAVAIKVEASPTQGGEVDTTGLKKAAQMEAMKDNTVQWINCKKIAIEKYGVFVPPDPF